MNGGVNEEDESKEKITKKVIVYCNVSDCAM